MKGDVEFAKSIGMPRAALAEVVDGIRSKNSVQYIRKTLRRVHHVTMSNAQWSTIKQWAKDNPLPDDEVPI
jgi:hypothetical protein